MGFFKYSLMCEPARPPAPTMATLNTSLGDWARSGRTGRYAAAGMAEDFEQRLAALELPVLAQRLRDDWLGPAASLDWLLGKMPRALRRHEQIAPEDLGGKPADHFGWMKTPEPIATRIAEWIAARDAAFAAAHRPGP